MTAPVPVRLPPALAELLAGATWERNEAGEAGASVHRVALADGQAFYLKYGTGRVADDVADEAARLRWAEGRLPVAPLRLFIHEPGEAWLLTAEVPGRTADAFVDEDPERLPLLVPALARFMRRVHALPVGECPFEAEAAVRLAAARRNVAAGLVLTDEFDEERRGWSAAAVLAEAERLAPCASGRVVTHGDFSLGNILLDEAGEVTGCIDVGRMGVADPYQDIAVLRNNLREYGPEPAAALLRELGIERVDEERILFHSVLDELF